MAKDLMLLYGRNSVFERLQRNPQTIKKITLQDNFVFAPNVERLIKENNISLERAAAGKLQKIKPAKDLQGIVAEVERFAYTPLDELLERPQGEKITPIFLDRINDPQNLGAMLRSAACFGGFALVLPRFEACGINETVLHVAQGGENYLPVALVANLTQAVITAKRCGYWIMGAEADQKAQDINEISFPFPLALVLGSEAKGIRLGLSKQLDLKVRIPMPGAKLSFNVSAACVIFCHEIAKRRGAA